MAENCITTDFTLSHEDVHCPEVLEFLLDASDSLGNNALNTFDALEHSGKIHRKVYFTPVAPDYCITDVSYAQHNERGVPTKPLVSRGLSYIIPRAAQLAKDVMFLRRGLEKFGDLCFPCFDTLNRPLKEQPLINIGLSHEHRRLDCVLTLDLVLRLQRFDLKARESTFDLYVIEKLNGTNAQVSWVPVANAWICASKNVSLLCRCEDDLRSFQYSERRFHYAKLIAHIWLLLIKGLSKTQLACLQQCLSQFTFVGELVGVPGSQHLVHYNAMEIRWFGCVSRTKPTAALSPKSFRYIAQTLWGDVDSDTSPFRLAFCYEEIRNIKLADLPSVLKRLINAMKFCRLEDRGEGAVINLVGRCQCTTHTTSSDLRPKAWKGGGFSNECLLGCVKAKTLEYLLLRRIREKCRTIAEKREREEPLGDVSFHCKAYQAYAQTLVEPEQRWKADGVIKAHTQLLETSLRKVLEYSPQLSSEWINLNFLDFLKLQLPSPLSPINGCADQTLDLSTVEIHVLLPPFVLTPNNVIELQHSVKAAGEAASNGTVNTTLFLWHDPRQCAKALSVPEFVNETDSFSMSFSTARVPLSHSLKLVFLLGYDAEGVAASIRLGRQLLVAIKGKVKPTPVLDVEPDAKKCQAAIWSLEEFKAVMVPAISLSEENVKAKVYSFYCGPDISEAKVVASDVCSLWDDCIGVDLNAITLALLGNETEFSLPYILEFWKQQADALLRNLQECPKPTRQHLNIRFFSLSFSPKYICRVECASNFQEALLMPRLSTANEHFFKKLVGIVRSNVFRVAQKHQLKDNATKVSNTRFVYSETVVSGLPDPQPLSSASLVKKKTMAAGLISTSNVKCRVFPLVETTYLVVVGLPGSGKSTLLQRLFKAGQMQNGSMLETWNTQVPLAPFQYFTQEKRTASEGKTVECPQHVGNWRWDATALFSADAYTEKDLHRLAAFTIEDRQASFKTAQRSGVVNQRKDLETFFDTEVVRLVLNRLRSRDHTETVQAQHFSPVRILLILDKNLTPTGFGGTKRSFFSCVRTMMERIQHQVHQQQQNGTSYNSSSSNLHHTLCQYNVRSSMLVTVFSNRVYDPEAVNASEEVLQTQSTVPNETNSTSVNDWPFYWDPHVVSECIYRAVIRQNNSSLQGSQAVLIICSFVSLFRNWNPTVSHTPDHDITASAVPNNDTFPVTCQTPTPPPQQQSSRALEIMSQSCMKTSRTETTTLKTHTLQKNAFQIVDNVHRPTVSHYQNSNVKIPSKLEMSSDTRVTTKFMPQDLGTETGAPTSITPDIKASVVKPEMNPISTDADVSETLGDDLHTILIQSIHSNFERSSGQGIITSSEVAGVCPAEIPTPEPLSQGSDKKSATDMSRNIASAGETGSQSSNSAYWDTSSQNADAFYTYRFLPFVASFRSNAWYSSMKRYISEILFASNFCPFERNDQLQNSSALDNILTLCRFRHESFLTLDDSSVDALQRAVTTSYNYLLATVQEPVTQWVELTWTLSPGKISSRPSVKRVPLDYGQRSEKHRHVDAVLSTTSRARLLLPLYSYLDFSQSSFLDLSGGLISAFVNAMASFLHVPDAIFLHELRNSLKWIKSPHVTLRYYNHRKPYPSSHEEALRVLPGYSEMLRAEGCEYHCRIDYLIYIRAFILVASVTPLHRILLSPETSGPASVTDPLAKPSVEQTKPECQEQLPLLPAAPGRHLHITLAVGSHVKPYMSNLLLDCLDSSMLTRTTLSSPVPAAHTASFYRTPGCFNTTEYPPESIEAVKQMLEKCRFGAVLSNNGEEAFLIQDNNAPYNPVVPSIKDEPYYVIYRPQQSNVEILRGCLSIFRKTF